MSLRLYKSEKLCSVTAINTLFDRHAANFTLAVFPIRVFWRIADNRDKGAPMQFLISVPKKRLRHAVDRVTMRRRIREAYRLHHQDYPLPEGVKVDVAFVYVDSKLHSYQRVERSICRLLAGICENLEC
ncbi:MAG: ribonuclease P protein component [Muribaculaceae bacterium]|nr:ribonuclease P protein component [Muribaculaceae bacterium]